MKKTIVIGGGAAGFFSAINIKENNPEMEVIILEKAKNVLQKVRISGGGRCNVTHACFIPKDLTKFYPRGNKELLGPFHTFMTGDTMEWFETRGVPLKIEEDNRVFPVSNDSESIASCLLQEADKLNVKVLTGKGVQKIKKTENGWNIFTKEDSFACDYLVVTPGSSKPIWQLLEQLGHTIIPTVPSLFTFNIKDSRIKNLPGISVPKATVSVVSEKLTAKGPLLITHWGMSGPGILKLSSFGARILAEKKYTFKIKINWLSKSFSEIEEILIDFKTQNPRKLVCQRSPFSEISKRLWEQLIITSKINDTTNWADLSKKQIQKLLEEVGVGIYEVQGKSTFKEEFVTAGGVDLKEINFKKFESRIHSNLFLAGEILNIDAVTGGFNFQNAWTGGFIIGQNLGK
ncbi:BaiN/RdsA family NAD(P)/FAD-dependent oxidoreductase [Aureivirga marina]|uniref:NAD(P)/FAD-dependent oxidoreductase n=1 Tax=Aureivirga marina TaxID=1182451 RepID=UPI0018CB6036|nr:NAD(P)/FAD-dependent oxidoreductase [Aureivirga marina]